MVLLFPPSAFCRSLVSTESRYGTCTCIGISYVQTMFLYANQQRTVYVYVPTYIGIIYVLSSCIYILVIPVDAYSPCTYVKIILVWFPYIQTIPFSYWLGRWYRYELYILSCLSPKFITKEKKLSVVAWYRKGRLCTVQCTYIPSQESWEKINLAFILLVGGKNFYGQK